MSRSDILLVGQTPPPYHGQSVVTGMLFEDEWAGLKVERLRMAYSDTIDVVGKASFGKVLHLISLIFQTWKIAFLKRPKVFYYLPASSNKAAVIRDVIYLSAVRWCFKKTVFHYHAGGLPEYLEGAGLLGKLGHFVYKNADISIEISQTEFPPARAFDAKCQVFVRNGLDVVKMQSQSNEGVFNILFVGALNEGKGVMESLKAVNTVQATTTQSFKIQLAGAWASDDFKKECEAYIIENKLDGVVEFLGIIKGDEKWQAYGNADVFLFPSHYHAENFPLVLIEAMGCGLPVITTNWRGIPQLTGGSEAAILCDVNNQSQIVAALVKYMNEPDFLAQSSANAELHYQKNYTRKKFVTAIRTQFENLLK